MGGEKSKLAGDAATKRLEANLEEESLPDSLLLPGRAGRCSGKLGTWDAGLSEQTLQSLRVRPRALKAGRGAQAGGARARTGEGSAQSEVSV